MVDCSLWVIHEMVLSIRKPVSIMNLRKEGLNSQQIADEFVLVPDTISWLLNVKVKTDQQSMGLAGEQWKQAEQNFNQLVQQWLMLLTKNWIRGVVTL